MNLASTRNLVIVLSGPIAAGKSTLAAELAKQLGMQHLRTRQALLEEAKSRGKELGLDRKELQDYGDQLDKDTDYGWLANRVAKAALWGQGVVVDSIRKIEQVEVLRKWQDLRVVHVFVWADERVLHQRHQARDGKPHPGVMHANEQAAWNSGEEADFWVENSRMTLRDEVRLVTAFMGWRPPVGFVDALVGGQYGSEGKGHIVSYLSKEYSILVRVGGPNAGHTVRHPVTDEPISFYHLPSGALHSPNSYLVLGAGANIYIPTLLKEITAGDIDPARIVIDARANIITDEDRAAEGALVKGIGSTGQGVGVATAGKILGRTGEPRKLAGDNKELKELGVQVADTLMFMTSGIRTGEAILLEGTQGTGLSLHHGPYPYVTSRDTSVGGTAAEAGIAPSLINKVYMVCRTNPIRVQSPEGGTSGPMAMETTWEEVSRRAGVDEEELRKKETTTTTKRQRRVAEFDWELLYRSSLLNRPTDIALTFVDYIHKQNQSARMYHQLTPTTREFIENVERVSGARVSLITTRFHKRSIIDRRLEG